MTKAEKDWRSLTNEMKLNEEANYDDVCFHAQQSVEKYLKAYLQETSVRFNKTHDLPAPLNLLIPLMPNWISFRVALETLTDYAVVFRYPGRTATQEEAIEAVRYCAEVRAVVRPALGLSV